MDRDEAYFDGNAGMPLRPEARDAIVAALSLLPGNASAAHGAGRRVRRAISEAREAVAALVGAAPREVVFTSGAAEANAAALRGALAAARGGGVVTSRAEHPSVLRLCERLEQEGVDVRYAPVDRHGSVNADEFVALAVAQAPVSAVASLVFAQSVTGALQPVARATDALRARGITVHTDAAQAPGRVALDFQALGVDLMSVSAQKLGGPPGVGALVIRDGARWVPPNGATSQEGGRRPGTEAVPLIAGFGAAARAAAADRESYAGRARAHADRIRAAVTNIPGGDVLSPADESLGNTILAAFDGCPGDAMLAALDARGVRVSTGTACSSFARVPAEVLVYGGRTTHEAARAVRISTSWSTSTDDVERLCAVLAEVVRTVRVALATS
ncbi:MAG: aminotransferase class V-fold PLP-dependent enzyme [Planctomycetes bacterium]|nr:aminotransferase class V-fold PLP-dependent enzyme [Planctomycetota bacterium]